MKGKVRSQRHFIHINDLVWTNQILTNLFLHKGHKIVFLFLEISRQLLTQSCPWTYRLILSFHETKSPWMTAFESVDSLFLCHFSSLESYLDRRHTSPLSSLLDDSLFEIVFKLRPTALGRPKTFFLCFYTQLAGLLVCAIVESLTRWYRDQQQQHDCLSPWQDESPSTYRQHRSCGVLSE